MSLARPHSAPTDAAALAAFNALARAVHDLVAEHSMLAEVIVRKQCEFIGTCTSKLSADELPALAERIGRSVGMFTNPAKGNAVRDAILALR